MRRKDGRELVTEYPVTGHDRISYIPADELPPLSERTITCRRRESFRDSSMLDDDPSPEDFDSWGA